MDGEDNFMEICIGSDSNDNSVEILLNCQELKRIIVSLEKFEDKINQFKVKNQDAKRFGFTHLHLQDCGLTDVKDKSDIVFYVNMDE